MPPRRRTFDIFLAFERGEWANRLSGGVGNKYNFRHDRTFTDPHSFSHRWPPCLCHHPQRSWWRIGAGPAVSASERPTGRRPPSRGRSRTGPGSCRPSSAGPSSASPSPSRGDHGGARCLAETAGSRRRRDATSRRSGRREVRGCGGGRPVGGLAGVHGFQCKNADGRWRVNVCHRWRVAGGQPASSPHCPLGIFRRLVRQELGNRRSRDFLGDRYTV